MSGWRKFGLGAFYLVGNFGLAGLAIWTGNDQATALVAAVAGFATGLATGLGVIVWGNVQEHRARNGGGPS